MEYTPQHEIVGLPFGQSNVQAPLYYLHKAQGNEVEKSGPLYFLQAARNGVLATLQRGEKGEQKQRWANELFGEYIEHAEAYATKLVEAVPRSDVTAFVCVPTKRNTFMRPYHSAAATLCPSAIDFTEHLAARPEWASDSGSTLDQKVAQLDFRPPNALNPGQHLLVIDDVISSGASAAAVILRLAQHYEALSLRFSLACALWILPGE